MELYFNACRLDKDGQDSEYCCALVGTLLRGNVLAWYRLACMRNPTTIPTKLEDLLKAQEIQFEEVEEVRNARDKLRNLRIFKSVL